MSEENSSTAAILRMVRWAAVLQDAERLRSPYLQNPMESLSRTIHMGDARTAKEALLRWNHRRLAELRADPTASLEMLDALEAIFEEMWSKIDGRLGVMATELGYYSQNVAPDFGKHTRNFKSWASPQHLGVLFHEGNEFLIQGHMGTGKTHLAVLFMEQLLAMKATHFVVVTNVSGIQDKSGEWTPRVHHVSLLSEILRGWCDLPEETKIFLVLDEPESNLRGGTSKGLNAYLDFRYMIRKLGIVKAEIWHNFSEQYRSIREDTSESVYRILKDTPTTFEFKRREGNEAIVQRIDQVPPLERLSFATRGMGSIDIDVNMKLLLRRIAKLYLISDIKQAVREALDDPRIYLAEFQDQDEIKHREEKGRQLEDEEIVRSVLEHPERYLGKAGRGFERGLVARAFGLTDARSRVICKQAWLRRGTVLSESELAIMRQVLERRHEFRSGRGYVRSRIQAAFNVSERVARRIVKELQRREGSP